MIIPLPIKRDVLKDSKTGGNSKITLKTLCSEVEKHTTAMKKSGMFNDIVACNYSYNEFSRKFFRVDGRSGGSARASCE